MLGLKVVRVYNGYTDLLEINGNKSWISNVRDIRTELENVNNLDGKSAALICTAKTLTVSALSAIRISEKHSFSVRINSRFPTAYYFISTSLCIRIIPKETAFFGGVFVPCIESVQTTLTFYHSCDIVRSYIEKLFFISSL